MTQQVGEYLAPEDQSIEQRHVQLREEHMAKLLQLIQAPKPSYISQSNIPELTGNWEETQ